MRSWATSGSKQQPEAQVTFHLVAAELLHHSLGCFENSCLLPRQSSADWLEWWRAKIPVQTHPILWIPGHWEHMETYSALAQEATAAAAIRGVFKTGIKGTKKVFATCLQLFQHFTRGCLLFIDFVFVHSDHAHDFAQLWENHCSLNTCHFCPFWVLLNTIDLLWGNTGIFWKTWLQKLSKILEILCLIIPRITENFKEKLSIKPVFLKD